MRYIRSESLVIIIFPTYLLHKSAIILSQLYIIILVRRNTMYTFNIYSRLNNIIKDVSRVYLNCIDKLMFNHSIVLIYLYFFLPRTRIIWHYEIINFARICRRVLCLHFCGYLSSGYIKQHF